MGNSAMLKFNKVTKRFGGIVALKDFDLEVKEGEFVFITGPSGSGKTTVLKLILRDLLPTDGTIEIDGVDITDIKKKDIPSHRQNMGVVFQDFKVLPNKTVKENVEVALAVIGLSSKEWKARVSHVLDLVGLSERANLFPSQLSGGELQRVSLARALVVNPKIILADEPTGNLDWETSLKLMDLFEKINKEGKTILMATHHQRVIDKLKKRTVKLEKNPDEVMEKGKKKKKRPEPKDTKDKEQNDEGTKKDKDEVKKDDKPKKNRFGFGKKKKDDKKEEESIENKKDDETVKDEEEKEDK